MKGIGAKKTNFPYLELARNEPPRIIRFHSYCLATQREVGVFHTGWKVSYEHGEELCEELGYPLFQ